MKKNFLVSVSAVAAAVISQAQASTPAVVNASAPFEPAVDATSIKGYNPFVLERSAPNLTVAGESSYHESHASHASHESHASHASSSN